MCLRQERTIRDWISLSEIEVGESFDRVFHLVLDGLDQFRRLFRSRGVG